MKLKPCPFCGGEAEIEREGTTRQSCIVVCSECGCRLESSETFNSGSSWNKRADEAKVKRLLKAAREIDKVLKDDGISPIETIKQIQRYCGFDEALKEWEGEFE